MIIRTAAQAQLSTFGAKFLDQVCTTVVTIVSEFQPMKATTKLKDSGRDDGMDKRTIKPTKGKGYDGGIKYYHEGIFYKVSGCFYSFSSNANDPFITMNCTADCIIYILDGCR